MHILLLILKIIGIILLVLLGIVLLLVLLLVFVPFCYRAEGSYYEEKPYVMARVRYLFPLLQVFVRYKDGEAEGKVKIFGITVYDLLAPTEPKKESQKSKSGKKKTFNEAAAFDKENDDDNKQSAELTEITDKPAKISEEDPPKVDSDKISDQEEVKLSFNQKMRRFISWIRQKINKIIELFRQIREKGIQIKEKAEEFSSKIQFYYEIWQKEETKRAFQTTKRTLYRLWKRIRPKKGLIKIHFGTGDPGSTGQMCGYFGMFYPFIGKYVMIEPDFEKKIYEGYFYFKGHITMFALLKAAWVVLFDKDIKKLRKILMN